MSALLDLARVRREDLPSPGWWVLLGVAMALHLALPLGWAAGLGLIVLVMVQRVRPLDFITSYFLVVAGASLVNYGRGFLTFELSILAGGLVFMLFCYALERRSRWLTFPHTPLTVPLLAYLGLSIVNYGRGVLVGNSLRYAGLDLIAALGIASAFLVGSRGLDRTSVRAALIWIYVLSLAHTALGMWAYLVLKVRVGTIYFTPVPGVAFALLLAYVLRARSTGRAVLGLLALTPLLLHQFISFTRGYWFALFGATLFAVFTYTGRGAGVGARWKRTGIGLAFMILVAAGGSTMFASTLGITNIGELAGSRLTTSTSTEMSWESGSNVVRLVEYFHVIDLIQRSPWFGHGFGYSFVVREPVGFRLSEQWSCHQNYLHVALKQGLLGLALFVWVLTAAFLTGYRGRRLPETWRSAWCVGTATATVYLIIYCMVHMPLTEVNTVFITALLWGGAMSLASTGQTVVRWRASSREDGSQ